MRESFEQQFFKQFEMQLAEQEDNVKKALESRSAKKTPVKLDIIIPLATDKGKVGAIEERAGLLSKLNDIAKGFALDFTGTDANTKNWGVVVKLRPCNAGDPKNKNNPGDFAKLKSFVQTYNDKYGPSKSESKDIPKEQKRRSLSDTTSVAPLIETFEAEIGSILKSSPEKKLVSASFKITTPAEPVFQALMHSRSCAGFVARKNEVNSTLGIMDFKRDKTEGITTVSLRGADRDSLEKMIAPLGQEAGLINTPFRQKLVEGLQKQVEDPLKELYTRLDKAAGDKSYNKSITFDIGFPAEEKGVRMLFEAFKHGRSACGFVPDTDPVTKVKNAKNVFDLVHNPDANTATITLRNVEDALMKKDNKFRNGVTEHLTKSLTEQLTQQHEAYISATSSADERARSASPDVLSGRKSPIDPECFRRSPDTALLKRPTTPAEVGSRTPSPRDGQNNNNASEQGRGRW